MASDSIAILRNGDLLPPIDQITANGLAIWENSPPLYHDLNCTTYTFNDLREWLGKFRKYRIEAIEYAVKCKKLEQEVYKLHLDLAQKNEEIDSYNSRYDKASSESVQYEESIKSCSLELNTAELECNQLRKGKKQQKELENDINQMQHQINQNRVKHEEVTGDRDKLNFERNWFFRQRLLLQKTTAEELKNIENIKENLNKLRFCLHKSWRDTKELDLLGRLRARANYDYSPEWFAVRKRTVNNPAESVNPN